MSKVNNPLTNSPALVPANNSKNTPHSLFELSQGHKNLGYPVALKFKMQTRLTGKHVVSKE